MRMLLKVYLKKRLGHLFVKMAFEQEGKGQTTKPSLALGKQIVRKVLWGAS
jgi:hypothetical protein